MKLDRRRKYYMVLDCETATLPYANSLPPEAKKNVAIAKPLIYDLGWQIIDKKGNVYDRKNFLITEIFSVPEIFDTAYYASKRPIYLDKLAKNDIVLTDWRTAVEYLVEALDAVDGVGAYNSMFDFKKAIPFTELYINQLYSPNFGKWMEFQKTCCDSIAAKKARSSGKKFEADVFRFRGEVYPMFDLWGLSCRYLLNNDEYRDMCVDNGWITESGKYFKTSAETTFRYVTGELTFDEAHTAIDDAEIESEIMVQVVKKAKNRVEFGIIHFPFREVGRADLY